MDEAGRTVSQLWDDHRRDAFPPRFLEEEIAGVDMVMADADVAGLVCTWLSGRGRFQQHGFTALRDVVRDLGGVLPLLHDQNERRYTERLRDLAELVLEAAR